MMNKKYFFAATMLVVVGSSTNAIAQKTQLLIARNAVGKLQEAIANQKDEKTQLQILADGIKASENAQKDSKTKKYPETWAIKSYLSSYIAIKDPNQATSDKYYEQAKMAIDSAKNFDRFEDNSGLIAASNYNINIKKQKMGNSAYESGDYNVAFNYLKEVSDYFPKDSALAINTALSAQAIKNDDEALNYFRRAKDDGARNPVIFQRMATIYKMKMDTESALKITEEGLKVNPYNEMLGNDYINQLLDSERYTEAMNRIENTLKVNTRSKLLYFLYGYLHQKNANMGTAELAYNKSLDIDKNYFDALYQLGLLYLNLGNKALQATPQDIPTFSSYLNRSEVIFNKTLKLKPKDKSVINLLIEIYTRKNRFDRVQELKAQLDVF